MDLNEKIKDLNKFLERAKKEVVNIENELKRLGDSYQPTTKELLTKPNDFFTYTVKKEKYRFILGGDGRSQPWDEERIGNVATVVINKGIYVTNEQKKAIESFIEAIENVKDVKFKHD